MNIAVAPIVVTVVMPASLVDDAGLRQMNSANGEQRWQARSADAVAMTAMRFRMMLYRERDRGTTVALLQTSVRNILLMTMSADDYALLEPHLDRIPLPVRLPLHVAGQKIEHVYFPEDGIVSIVAVTLDGDECEVGIFGREGMSETATVLGTDHSPHAAYVQSAGVSGLKLPVAVLNRAFDESPTLRRHLLQYVQAMLIQLSSSITAAGQTVEQRLARWILMCHDRVEGDEIHLTHEFIGMMLGVRRSSVTDAMITLNKSGLISTRRGIIVVRDRAGLEATAAGGYGLAEHEYSRLLGVSLRKVATGALAHTNSV